MKLSWNWLSEWVDLEKAGGPAGLDRLLTSRGIEVEDTHELGKGFEKVVVAKILKKSPHPGADKLSLCEVTVGEGEPLQIVCGAKNMKEGDLVALAQVGALLPNGLKISASKIRGVESFGMLCSEEELGLKDSSEGILILPSGSPLGKNVGALLGRDDVVFELKLTANRADCLSIRGVAREVAAALGTSVRNEPKGYREEKIDFQESGTKKLKLKLEAGEAGAQFYSVYIEGVKVGPSPAEWVKKLESMGNRSINNLVDATNLVLLELGHPVHAYDATKIQDSALSIRLGQDGETLPLLDGTEIKTTREDLVIANGDRAVALAGVMGGGNSEISEKTTSVILECAEFDPVRVRRAAKRHGKHTEASHRFERGIDRTDLARVTRRLASLILESGGGKVIEGAAARLDSRKEGHPAMERRTISLSQDFISSFLGVDWSNERIKSELEKLGCEVISHGKDWKVRPPIYRLDLEIPEDLAEEAARTIGLDQIPSTLPGVRSSLSDIRTESEGLAKLNQAKDALTSFGFTETLNYSFTSKEWLAKSGFTGGIPVLNPLSEEQEQLTPSLLPGLLKNALDSFHHHFGSERNSIRLFELRPTFHLKNQKIEATGKNPARADETGVQESWRVALFGSGARYAQGIDRENPDLDFYDWKGILLSFLERIGVRGVMVREFSGTGDSSHLFHPGQSASVVLGKEEIGTFGRLHPKFEKAMKLRQGVWISELNWELLKKFATHSTDAFSLKNLPNFPSISRDFSLQVAEDINAERILQLCLKVGRPLTKSAKVFDIYQGQQLQSGLKSISVRVTFSDPNRSLTEEEVDPVSKLIVEALVSELKASQR